MRVCWCGNTNLEPYGAGRDLCRACGALVRRDGPEESPDREAGAAASLAGPAPAVLRALLRFVSPPAGVLHVGAAGGALAELLALAGCDVRALAQDPESAACVESALAGRGAVAETLEALDLAPGSLKALVATAPERLTDPEQALAACAKALSRDGVMLLRTPCFPEGLSHDRLRDRGDPFCAALETGRPFLFGERAVRLLLERLSFRHTAVIEDDGHALFLAASRVPIRELPPEEGERALAAQPGGRLAGALLTLSKRAADAEKQLARAQGRSDAGLEAAFKETASGWVAEARLPGLVNKTLGRMARLNWFFVKLSKYALRERGRFAPGPQGRDPKGLLAAVDLTPVLPGGDNGGAKLLTVNLLKELAALRPDWRFVCLTADASHDELARLDAPNLKRVRAETLGKLKGLREVGGERIDLLFCPFTMPYFHHPDVPAVSVVYDLQYAYYPQFFSSEEEAGREKTFMETARRATKLACISDFVRDTVLEKGNVPASRVHTVYIGLPARLEKQPEAAAAAVLAAHGLEKERYLLYPANFWAHKNHEMLLTAFGMHLSDRPDSGLKLVLTGADTGRRTELGDAASRMGLADRVLFPGFVSDRDMAILMQSCAALIFPSLFEGFGMPLIEAMTLKRPILCSNAASLPEVGGDAALYFDPKRPEEIAAAVAALETDPERMAALVANGKKQLARIGGPREMAEAYAALFEEAVRRPLPQSWTVRGLDANGRTGGRVFAAFGPGAHRQWLEAEFYLPADAPAERVNLEMIVNGRTTARRRLKRGGTVSFSPDVPPGGGYVEILCEPAFRPPQGGKKTCCRCRSLVLTDGAFSVDLLSTSSNEAR